MVEICRNVFRVAIAVRQRRSHQHDVDRQRKRRDGDKKGHVGANPQPAPLVSSGEVLVKDATNATRGTGLDKVNAQVKHNVQGTSKENEG